jgi:hypothetical protein
MGERGELRPKTLRVRLNGADKVLHAEPTGPLSSRAKASEQMKTLEFFFDYIGNDRLAFVEKALTA